MLNTLKLRAKSPLLLSVGMERDVPSSGEGGVQIVGKPIMGLWVPLFQEHMKPIKVKSS